MKNETSILVLEPTIVNDRMSLGLMSPLESGHGLELVDCSDDRDLTEDCLSERFEKFGREITPGRFYGGASGIAISGLITFAAEHGDRAVFELVRDYSPEAFVDFASDLSDRAFSLDHRIVINQHSDNGKEKNPITLGHKHDCHEDLGCAFATNLGFLLHSAGLDDQLDESGRILSEVGSSLPLDEAREGIDILAKHIPESFGVKRETLRFAREKRGLYAPVAIHAGHHAPNEEAAVVVDLAGYRSNVNRHNEAGLARYHHTPDLAAEILSKVMPEIKFNPELLAAGGLLLGVATRRALSGEATPHSLGIEVIPPELKLVA